MKKMTVLLPVLLLCACASNIHRAEFEADPYENFNRKMFAFNDSVYENVFFPIGKGYRKITTPTIRKGVNNFVDNIFEPVSAANYLLQLKAKESAIGISRFVVNTTLGLGGLFDVADGWGLKKEQTSMNETLASWCVADGPYLVIPFIGSSNPRNLAGMIVDKSADPLYWATVNDANVKDKVMIPYQTATYVAEIETYMDIYNDMKKNSVDFYATMRSAYLQQNQKNRCRFAKEENQSYDFDFEDEE